MSTKPFRKSSKPPHHHYTSPLTKNKQQQQKSQKRKAENISSSSSNIPPEASGFTVSSLPPNLLQSTPKPVPSHNTPTSNTSSTISSLTATLATEYEITPISILSSSSISKKVTTTLSALSTWQKQKQKQNQEQEQVGRNKDGGLNPLVVFTAKAEVASKCISIVEIAKREIAGEGGKWFQYTAVEGKIEERKENQKQRVEGAKGTTGGNEKDDGGETDEEEVAFEVMKTPFERAIEGQKKVRENPFVTVFLARGRVDSLRRRYGEQTNAEAVPREREY